MPSMRKTKALKNKPNPFDTSFLLRFVRETKGREMWEATLQMLDIQSVIDLSPGSGTLAGTCLRLQIPYLGILRSEVHQSYLANCLDRQSLQCLSDAESILYNENVAEMICDHFAETLAELNAPDLDDGSDLEDP